MAVKSLATPDDLAGWLLGSLDTLHVALCLAEWDAPSKHMEAVVAQLAALHPAVSFATVRPRAAMLLPPDP